MRTMTIRWLAPIVLTISAGCSGAPEGTEEPFATGASALGAGSVDADAATHALLERYWNGAYLRDADPATAGPCGHEACYWIFAQAFDAVLDGVQRTQGQRFSSWVGRLYDAQDARGWIEPQASKFFDDENWMALALIRAYDVTSESKYLCHAVKLYRDIKSEGFRHGSHGFDGIWWNAAHTQLATAANFGPAITAARLHERPAMDACPEARRGYVDATTTERDAREIYGYWRDAMTRVDASGDREVADHAASNCPSGVCWWDYTYNQGVGIGAALELSHMTGDGRYASEAHQMASYMIHNEVQGGVLHDHGSCRGDCPAFKGIAYRFLLKLYETDPTQLQYRDVLSTSAVAIWNDARETAREEFGAEWAGPAPKETTLAADASAVMALNLAVEWGVY
jgi:predicted alpha-1,6-mannanase (GH76 family)